MPEISRFQLRGLLTNKRTFGDIGNTFGQRCGTSLMGRSGDWECVCVDVLET